MERHDIRAAGRSNEVMIIAQRTYSQLVLVKRPVAYWRLGEPSGPTAADASKHGHTGRYVGNPTFGEVGAIRASTNRAVGLNGPSSRDYIEIADPGHSAAFSQPTSGHGLSVEVWMRPDALTFAGQTSEKYIHWLGKCDPVSNQCEWGFRFYSQDSPSRPNRISAYIWNPDGGEGAGAYFEDTLVAGDWIHIVAVFEPGDQQTQPPAGVHIYRDGVHRLGPPSPGTLYKTFNISPAHGNAPVRLGTREAASTGGAAVSYLTGALDEVAIYPRVLSAAEILENYQAATAHHSPL
jgi:Concanavalin A-like lectin/glucanases superfamily